MSLLVMVVAMFLSILSNAERRVKSENLASFYLESSMSRPPGVVVAVPEAKNGLDGRFLRTIDILEELHVSGISRGKD